MWRLLLFPTSFSCCCSLVFGLVWFNFWFVCLCVCVCVSVCLFVCLFVCLLFVLSVFFFYFYFLIHIYGCIISSSLLCCCCCRCLSVGALFSLLCMLFSFVYCCTIFRFRVCSDNLIFRKLEPPDLLQSCPSCGAGYAQICDDFLSLYFLIMYFSQADKVVRNSKQTPCTNSWIESKLTSTAPWFTHHSLIQQNNRVSRLRCNRQAKGTCDYRGALRRTERKRCVC